MSPPPLKKKSKPKHIVAASEQTRAHPSGRPHPAPLFLRISTSDKIFFTKYLAVLLRAGIPLREALDTLRGQQTSKSLHHVLDRAVIDLSDGLPLGTSISHFPKIFNLFFANVITVGESSGTLPESLEYLAIQIEKSRELRGKIRSALLYPIIVFLGALGIGAYLAFGILPQLLPLFSSLNISLPITTRMLLAISQWLNTFGFFVAIGIIGIIIMIFLLLRIRVVRLATHHLFLLAPVFGTINRQVQITQCARILGTLLSSGVKIVPALRITAQSLTNLVYQRELDEIADMVEQGDNIGTELSRHPHLFPPSAASIVSVGERTGKLSESLLSLAEFTEKEMNAITQNMATLIEPLVLILVGVIVGFVALSIITPIYQLTQGLAR